jgi:hypothetical protein
VRSSFSAFSDAVACAALWPSFASASRNAGLTFVSSSVMALSRAFAASSFVPDSVPL